MDLDTKLEVKADVEKTSGHLISPFLNKETVVYYFAFTVMLLVFTFMAIFISIYGLEIRSDIKELNKKYDKNMENDAYYKAKLDKNSQDIESLNQNQKEFEKTIKEHEKRILKIESKGRY